ncbi:MAG: hypothetical protein M3416_03420 [Acidobacteriota bacterium]|nr:hypothetical protein [Acidobacteriota bacterium]
MNGWGEPEWRGWQRRYAALRGQLLAGSGSNVVGRVSGYIAAVQLAGEVACPLLGLPFSPEVVGAWLMLHLQEQQGDQNLVLQALRALADYYVANRGRFAGDEGHQGAGRAALCGAVKPQQYVGFLRSTVEAVFRARRWGVTAALNKLAAAGALCSTEGDRYTKKVTVNGVKHRMVCIKWSAVFGETAHDQRRV